MRDARDVWIGPYNNTSGSYVDTECKGLSRRGGGPYNAMRLYCFEPEFGPEMNITAPKVVANIDGYLTNKEIDKLTEYLYRLLLKRLGMMEFLKLIHHKIEREQARGFQLGKAEKSKEIREALGLPKHVSGMY